MRAVVYSGYGVMPQLAQVADPACPPDGVVIAVGASGVCRSDWHAWKGHDPVALPHIGGHELAGTVAQTGPEVTRWRAGDRVTVPFVCGCGVGARVVAADVATAALDRARELGASFTVQAGAGDPAAAIAEITGGGAHISVDALGSPATAACSVRCLRRRGRHVQVGLLLDGPTPVPMDLVVARELEIYGSHGMAARDYPPMMTMVADGTLRPGLLVGRVIGLADAGRALAAMDGPAEKAGMTVIRFSLQVGREPVGHLGPGLEGVVGQAVGTVGVQHQLGAGRLAGQAFGMAGRDQAAPRHVGRTSTSAGSIAAISSGSLVMTGCPRSLAQIATLTSTMSAVRVTAHRAPTRSAILASSGTTDVFDARSKRAIRA